MILKKQIKRNYAKKILPIIPKECYRCGDWFVLEGCKVHVNYTRRANYYYCEECAKEERETEKTMDWYASTPREMMDKVCNMVMGWDKDDKDKESGGDNGENS